MLNTKTATVTGRTANITGRAKRSISIICAVLLGSSVAWACDRDDERDIDRREFANKRSCHALSKFPFRNTVTIATAKLYIEHNAADEDTGVHGAFDDHGWSLLCVYNPKGKLILAVNPKKQLKDLTMAGIFFESREPPNLTFSIGDLMKDFPEGQYEVRGISFDGTGLIGAATFSHDIPAASTITFPMEEAVVNTSDLVVAWEHVTQTINGDPVNITGYEVIITKDVADDPNGFSRPTFDVHVPVDRNTLAVPFELLEPGTEYELEILALEESGNQTITVSFFRTE